jgi:hypothetical protein
VSESSEVEGVGSLVESLRRHLQRRQRAGIRLLAREEPRPPMESSTDENENFADGDLFLDRSPAQNVKSLEELRAEIGDCRLCKLCSGRTHVVFGVGNPNARLMFVGEGPGRDEDLQGEPFVGRAGQLLTDIIT